MILSMTGFGHATLEDGDRHYHVEIRSVNNRYLKTAARLPEELSYLEPQVEALLRNRISRGSVTLALHVKQLGAAAAQELNIPALQRYLEQLRSAAGTEPRASFELSRLVDMPGVCEANELSDRERERLLTRITGLLNDALDRLMLMRRDEGQALAADLQKHCTAMRQHLAAIADRVPLVVSEYQKRLHARVRELLHESGASLAEADLIREVAIYAERSDISEELSRLASHLDQFAEAISSGEPAGRKLDFIAQEMFREANTIGSKAGDAHIARSIIEIKGTIDRLKEQVQNVE